MRRSGHPRGSLKTADHWVDETLRVKKAKAEKAAQNSAGGITVDQK